MWFLMLVMLLEEPEIRLYEDLEIYQPITHDMVAVTERGELFVLDTKEKTVLRFAPDGSRLENIGSKGQGPGELEWPRAVYVVNDQLVVSEHSRANVYSLDGEPIRLVSGPGSVYYPTSSGWITSESQYSLEEDTEASLLWLDPSGRDSHKTHQWKRDKINGSVPFIIIDGAMTYNFAPAPERLFVRPSSDDQHIYVRFPSSKQILVLNPEGVQVGTIELPKQNLTFNEYWADQLVEEVSKKFKKGGSVKSVKVNPLYPEFFPTVMLMWEGPDGLVYVEQWTSSPGKNRKVLAYGAKGNVKKPGYTPDELTRIVAHKGDWAVITLWDKENEEASLALCKKADIKTVIASNEFDDSEMADFWERLVD